MKRTLYNGSVAVYRNGESMTVISCLFLSPTKEEAIGRATSDALTKYPGHSLAGVWMYPAPDDLVRQAAEEAGFFEQPATRPSESRPE